MSSNFIQALAGTRVYPITDQHFSGLSHAEQVVHLSKGGATLIQLREKTEDPLTFFTEAEAALQVARDLGVRILINDRVDIAMALKADGVHLGQDDLSPEAARRLLGDDSIIGLSTHSVNQARIAAKLPVNYVAIGPVFATATKSSAHPALGLSGLARVREAIGAIPLVAIGGINRKNAASVLEAGADVVAIISDFWAPGEDAATRTKLLFNLQ